MYRVNLIGLTDVEEFVSICSTIDGKTDLYCPSNGYRVSAKSLLGGLASIEWHDTYLDTDVDCYSKLEKFIVLGNDSQIYHE